MSTNFSVVSVMRLIMVKQQDNWLLDPANVLVYHIKKVKPKESSIKDHLLCNHAPSLDDDK